MLAIKTKPFKPISIIQLLYHLTLIIFFNCIFIDGLLPQIRENILPFPILSVSIVKLGLVFSSISIVFCRAARHKRFKINLNRNVFFYYILFIIYLILSALIQISNRTSTIIGIMGSYSDYYYSIILIPFFSLLTPKPRYIQYYWILISIPIIMLGFAQYFLSDPLLPTRFESNPDFLINSWQAFDKVRAFSLFSSGLLYGKFLSLLVSLSIFNLLKSKTIFDKSIIVSYILILLAAVYTTLTRNIYLECIQVFFCSFFIFLVVKNSQRSFKNNLIFIPIILGIISMISVLYSYFSIGNTSESIVNSESLTLRYEAWPYFLSLWNSSSLVEQFFGLGITQAITAEKNLYIDNNFIAVLLHIGLLGLVFWFALMWNLWSWMANSLSDESKLNSIQFVITAYWCTWISSGLYNITLSSYPLLLMLIFSPPKMKLQKLDE
jgi:hypothetical protein